MPGRRKTNDNKELISVVVTSYNHAEYLDQRMKSLLNQTYPNLEIIVVDDCSTDGSADVLAQYRGIPHVSIVLLEKNHGYANTSNLGVSLSRGEYVVFAECDDFSEPSQMATLYDALSKNRSAVVAFSKSTMVDESGMVTGDDFSFRESNFKRLCSSDTLIGAELMCRFLMFSCVIPNMSAAMFRRRNFDRIGGLSNRFRVCADWDFWVSMASEGDFYYVCQPLNNFRSHSTTVRSTFSICEQIREIYEIVYELRAGRSLSVYDSLRFRLNTGVIWASFLASPKNWILSFPRVLKNSLAYDKAMLSYLVIAIIMKVSRWAYNKTIREQ